MVSFQKKFFKTASFKKKKPISILKGYKVFQSLSPQCIFTKYKNKEENK